ncbi:hypothetical protein V5799_031883, partial [Amblyomma americanum]
MSQTLHASNVSHLFFFNRGNIGHCYCHLPLCALYSLFIRGNKIIKLITACRLCF